MGGIIYYKKSLYLYTYFDEYGEMKQNSLAK